MTMYDVIEKLMHNEKGILAADESISTMGKRLASINVEQNIENRRKFRQLLFTSEAMREFISGVILFSETIDQKADDGKKFTDIILDSGSLVGIKVDKGLKLSEGENVTLGISELDLDLKKFKEKGASFAKWRSLLIIDEKKSFPSIQNININISHLARYAKTCQDNDIVPIVEPELLMEGTHNIDKCYEVTSFILSKLFEKLEQEKVIIENIVLKPNMVIDGDKFKRKASSEEVAEMTAKCLAENCPNILPMVAFLSGGQTDVQATENLNNINKNHKLPFRVTYSYGRALQASALSSWAGKDENVKKAQDAFYHRAKMNSLASRGEWSMDMEK